MARRLAARPGAEPRCRTSCEDASTWSAARNRGSTPTYDRVEAAAGIALYAGLAAVPVRAGEARPRCQRAVARPGRTTSRRAEPHISDQAPPVWRAPEGAGGWRQGQGGPRDRPLRAAGSRVAISRAAGPEGARNTSGVHQAARPRKRAGRPRGGRARRRPEHRRSTQSSAASEPPLTLRRRRVRGVPCS